MPRNNEPCPRCGDTDLTTKDNCPLDLGCPHKHPDGYRPASPALSEETLLPCPFCGGKATVGKSFRIGTPPSSDFWQSSCVFGCARSSEEFSRNNAIAAWNRRPSTPDEREAIARIIDPEAWDINPRTGELYFIDVRRRNRALAEADAICTLRAALTPKGPDHEH